MSQTYNSATSDVPPKTIKIGVGGSNYEDVFFGNKYTYENGVVSKTELVIYDNADRDGAIVIGEIRKNGTIDFNNIAKTKTIGNSDLKWNDISRNNKKYLEKEIKKISNNENTWEALGVNKDKEKLNNFLKSNGIAASEEEVTDSVNANNAATNLEALKKKQFRKQYGNFFYPLGIKNNNQDRIKITVVDFKPQIVDEERQERTNFFE